MIERPTLKYAAYRPRCLALSLRASLPRTSGFTGRRILLLDDNADGREAVAMIVRYQGGVIFEAGSKPEALTIVRRQLQLVQPLHLLLLDYHLGQETGVDVLRELRPLVPQVPAVLASAYPPEEIVRDPRRFGFLSIVQKGGSVIDELQTLARLLEQFPLA